MELKAGSQVKVRSQDMESRQTLETARIVTVLPYGLPHPTKPIPVIGPVPLYDCLIEYDGKKRLFDSRKIVTDL